MDNYILGIDIGGTKTLFAIVPIDSRDIVYEYKQDTICTSQESFVEQLLAGLDHVLKSPWGQDVAAIGIGTAGYVDIKSGLLSSRNLNLHQLALLSIVKGFSGLPVVIDNDTNAGAIGELHYGKGNDNFAYVAVGTGIGMGLILNGRLFRGRKNDAGELGHVGVDLNGELCRCGHRGCLENLASGTAIAHIARKRLAAGENSILQGVYQKNPLLITGEQVFMALGRKDPLAESVIRNAARALGYALHNLVVLLDLKQIVLGGGVPSSSPQYLTWVRDAMVSQSNRTDEVTVELTDLGDYTAVLGGTIMAREKLQELG